MKIGILGGSFDPIHNGHVHMALAACKEFALDQVWLIPTGHSPNKEEKAMTDAEHRYRMCEIAAHADARLKVSRVEIDSDERSFTYRTLQKLNEEYSEDRFYFIMGGDSLDYFDRWVYPEIITKLCTILVMPRKPYNSTALMDKISGRSRVMNTRFPLRRSEKICLIKRPWKKTFRTECLRISASIICTRNKILYGADYGTK